MVKLKAEFSDFHECIKISSEANTLRSKRDILEKDFKDYFPSECNSIGITVNKSDMRFIYQGSYKIGTTIKNPSGSVDSDIAVIFPLDISEHDDPRKLKKAARDALKIENVREPDIKEPCVTVGYHKKEEEYIHIDFPMYAQDGDILYLARGKETSENYSWQEADPEGLNDYFINLFKDNEQLRRIVRYFKKWKLDKYSGFRSKNEIPPSIALTILACQNFVKCVEDSVEDDLTAFYKTLLKIKNQFTIVTDIDGNIIKADLKCKLPVTPRKDVLYKMRECDNHLILFYNRINTAVNNLKDACNLESEHDAAQYVQKVLGTEFSIPPKNASNVATSNKKEHSFG
jgi:hypothetical protein